MTPVTVVYFTVTLANGLEALRVRSATLAVDIARDYPGSTLAMEFSK